MYINTKIDSLNRISPSEDRSEYLRMDMNENPEGLPKEIFDRVIKRITPELLAMYPQTEELIKITADYLGVEKDCITYTNGSDEAIRTIFQVFGQEGKSIVSVTPSFAMYDIYAQMEGMTNKSCNYDSDFHISIDDVCAKIDDNTNIVSLVNPNNPMGNTYQEDEVKKVLETAKKHNAIVIIDEAYYYFYDKSYVYLLKEYDNLLITRTFSKLCSIAGLRIGYVITNPRFRELIDKARPTYCVNCVAIEYAKELLSDKSIISSLIKAESEGRQYIKNMLQKSGYNYYCDEGNFIFIKTHKPENVIEQKLKDNKMLIKTYGTPILKGYIRISTGGINSMKRFWDLFSAMDAQ